MDAKLYKAAASGRYDDTPESGRSLHEFIANVDPNVLLQETIPQRNSLLHVAVLNKQKDFAEEIIQLYPSLLYHKNSDEDTPLHIAARVGSTEIVQHILENPASQHQVEAEQISPTRLVNVAMDTALHDAVRNGHLKVVELLIGKDSGLALLLNAAGESPLFLAMERKHFDIAKHLLHKAQVCSHEGRDGMNALHAATLRLCEYGLLKEIVRKCPTAVVQTDDLECTPLHYAALQGYKEAIELFLTDESVLAVKNTLAYKNDKQGMSAFHMAAKNGHVQVMKKLVEICPDISEQLNCINRQTALHVAVQGGKDKAVKYLSTSFGSEGLVNKQDKDGNTPLHLAAIIEDSDIIEILLKRKAFDKNLVNTDGLTALDIIRSSTELSSFRKKYLKSRLESAVGLPSLKQELVGTNIGMEQPMQTKRELKPQQDKEDGNRNPKDQRARRIKRNFMNMTQFLSPSVVKNASNNDILIATIIATVTFAAAFQVPGGYESDGPHQGLPLFRNKTPFNSFIICDCLAFGLSSSSIFLHFLASISEGDHSTSAFNYVLQTALLSTYYSILAMVGAFISAVVLVSENSSGLKVASYVCGFSFVSGYLFSIAAALEDRFGGIQSASKYELMFTWLCK